MFSNIMLDQDILKGVGRVSNHSLTHILHLNDSDANDPLSIIKHSPYLDLDNFLIQLQDNLDKFIVISLNIQSLRAKFY